MAGEGIGVAGEGMRVCEGVYMCWVHRTGLDKTLCHYIIGMAGEGRGGRRG